MPKPFLPPLPDGFLARMRDLLGSEYPAFLASLQQPPALGLRVNTLKLTPQAFLARAPFVLQPLPWLPEGFLVIDPTARPGRHPYHAAGCYYLQDPSAMLAAVLLDPQPGQAVLDVSAAPGGKATHLAARLRGQGVLVANEVVRGRARTLVENLERMGAVAFLVTQEPVARLAQVWPGRFHRVLVDAPCSGEGMFRKSSSARTQWHPRLVEGNAARQLRLLEAAAATVATGGRLLYATCTFAPEENEAVVARFLRAHPDFTLVTPPRLPGLDPGRPDWISPSLARGLPLERCIRVWPHRSPGDGHFFALMQRDGVEPAPWLSPPSSFRVDAKTGRLLQTFWKANLTIPFPQKGWVQYGDFLHYLPWDADWWQPLRPLRAGWRVGQIRHKRFVPHHALALGLQAAQARRVLSLGADDPQVLAYLRGETLRSSGDAGWVLIAVEDFPLGWGKRVGEVVKNHYPRSWRWL